MCSSEAKKENINGVVAKSSQSWMWGQAGCDICHPIDDQGWLAWSDWLGVYPLTPSLLHVCAPPEAVHSADNLP